MAPSPRTALRRPLGRGCRAPGAEAGELLIETLVTVAIVGISFVAVLGAIFTSIRISDYNGKTTDANVVVRAYAEAMKAPAGTYAYQPCTLAGGTVTYPAWTPPAPYTSYTATITKIRYLTGYSAGQPTWAATCPAIDQGTQELTLSATGPNGAAAVSGTESVVILKRDARGES